MVTVNSKCRCSSVGWRSRSNEGAERGSRRWNEVRRRKRSEVRCKLQVQNKQGESELIKQDMERNSVPLAVAWPGIA